METLRDTGTKEMNISDKKKEIKKQITKTIKKDMVDYSEGKFIPGVKFNTHPAAEKFQKDPKIVNKDGKRVSLSAHQKNAIYSKAKDLKESIKNGLCTKEECDHPTDVNVKKMQKEFQMTDMMTKYRNSMKALNAEPETYSFEKMRGRGNSYKKSFTFSSDVEAIDWSK